MRKALIWLVATVLVAGPPALVSGEDQGHVTFDAPPCLVACALYVGTSPPRAGMVTCDVGDDPIYKGWDDVVLTAPEGAGYLRFQIFPAVDWDSLVCGPQAQLLGSGANTLGASCRNSETVPDSIPVGCAESIVVPVVPGEHYTLRAYNWADPFPAFGLYLFSETRPPDWD